MTAFFDWFDVVISNTMPTLLIVGMLFMAGAINYIEGERRRDS